MGIGDRIRLVREEAGDNIATCAKKIGVTRPAVSLIESGRNNASNQTIELFCREYGINREWLETGEGEMKKPPLDEVAAILADVLDKGFDDPLYNILLGMMKVYQALSEHDRAFLHEYLDATKKAQH